MSDVSRHTKLCWSILPKVSRSFAVCINKLPRGVDSRIMLSYLILRIVDTIEDSKVGLETKQRVFNDFIRVLKSETVSSQKEAALRETLLNDIDYTYERILLENVGSVLEVFRSFRHDEQRAISGCADEMFRGMMKFQTESVKDFIQQEEYCYYVAGLVGKMDNNLFYFGGHINSRLRDELADCSKRYGIGLQKVNVLRDVAYDIPMGRYFWPLDILKKHGLTYETLCLAENRKQAMDVLKEMVKNALPYLEDGVEYITRLPRTAVRVRLFCIIPLFMAIKSYGKCVGNENVFVKGKKVKIGKDDVQSVIRLSFMLVSSNWAIRRWYRSCVESVRGGLFDVNEK